MPFNHLLFEALEPAKTLAQDTEHGCYTSADLQPRSGETVLLFRRDRDRTREPLLEPRVQRMRLVES